MGDVIMDKVAEYLSSWNGRLRAAFLDIVILNESATSTNPVYPYSISKKLNSLWGSVKAPPLPTIYSSIKRLESNGFIQYNEEIKGGRVQKQLLIQKSGFDLLDKMNSELQNLLAEIQKIREGII